ncbi:Oxidoreductase, short chain dehydrogenase/reductase family protein [Aphelenchoides besseyi]|nr:Oxidoreductase, short chain dehydrogenase/reductase family protein [Aphelenchoides besseyi]
MSFKGKVVIVTGSSSGIGQSTAELFAAKGANVTIHGQNEERLQKTVELLKKNGVSECRLLVVRGLIEKEETRKQLINETIKKFGRLDVLVNNAAATLKPGTDANSFESYDYVMGINVRALMDLCDQATPHLSKTRGNIVNVSSIGAQQAFTNTIPYVCSKAAVNHYTRNLAVVLASKGIRVNSVSPGGVDTNFNNHLAKNREELDAIYKYYAETTIPLGRIAKPKEIAYAIEFLADNEKASYILGTNLDVDGGICAGRPVPKAATT